MSKMIDSNKQKLDFAQIAMIALENTRSQYPIKAAMPAILTEVNQPNTDVKQMGNTVFILHEGEDPFKLPVHQTHESGLDPRCIYLQEVLSEDIAPDQAWPKRLFDTTKLWALVEGKTIILLT